MTAEDRVIQYFDEHPQARLTAEELAAVGEVKRSSGKQVVYLLRRRGVAIKRFWTFQIRGEQS